MERVFCDFFTKAKMMIDWFFYKGFLTTTRAGDLLCFSLISIGIILGIVGDDNQALNKILLGTWGIIIFFLFFITGFKFFWLTPPKFLRKNSNYPLELFNIYSHGAYLYGVFVFCFFSSFFVTTIIIIVAMFYINLQYNFTIVFYNLFFLTTSIFTIIYFTYHIVIKEIDIKIVKATISQYVAITVTITAGVLGLEIKGILEPLITFLGVGFAWLIYIVDKLESEAT